MKTIKILLALLMILSTLIVAAPAIANDSSSYAFNEEELNEAIYPHEEADQFNDVDEIDEIEFEVEGSFEDFKGLFENLTLEELIDAISDELSGVLYSLDIIIEEASDLSQLLTLDDDIWVYFEHHENQDLYFELTTLVNVLEYLLNEDDEATIGEDDIPEDLETDVNLDEGLEAEQLEPTDVSSDVDLALSEQVDIAITPQSIDISPQSVSATNTASISHIRRTGVVVSNGQLRNASNASGRVLTNLSTNTNVTINRRQGSWYEVTAGSRTGWIERNQVARTSSFGVVTGNNVAIRASRGNNARVLTRANRGTRIRITRRTASWSQVRVNRRTGWVRNSQINITNGRPGRVNRRTDVRALPNGSASITRRIPNNTQIVQLQRTTNGWTQVELRHASGTLRGWVQTSHVRNQNHGRRVNNNGVFLRNRPSNRGRVIRRLNRNARVTVLSATSNWSFVSAGGRRGWVRNNQLNRLTLPRAIHNWTWVETQSARAATPGTPATNPVWGPAPGRGMINVNCGDGQRRLFNSSAEAWDFIFNPNSGICYWGNNPNASTNSGFLINPGQPFAGGTILQATQWHPAGEWHPHASAPPQIILTPSSPGTLGTPARAARGHWRCTITGRTTTTGTRAGTDPR